MLAGAEILLYIFLFLSLYFQVFLLITFFEKKGALRDNSHTAAPHTFPSVSIIVPCYNEEKTLASTVRSLFELHYPRDRIKLIIVDDGSTDNTLEIARRFEKDPRVRVLTQANGGKHTALNAGLQYADTEFVGCLDADSYVMHNALTEILKKFTEPRVMAVTPAIRIHHPSTIIQFIQKTEYNMSIFLRKTFGFLDAIQVTPGPFSFFRRSIFEKVGYYKKAHNTEDMEMALRLHKHGYRIENTHKALVFTSGPRSLKALYKQRLRWTYGFMMNTVDYRDLLFNRKYGNIGVFVLPAAVVSILSAVYFTLFFLATSFQQGLSKITEIRAAGSPGFQWPLSGFDVFFINTESALILSGVLVASSIVIAFLGKKMAEDSYAFSRDMIYFFVLYGFLAPLWLSKALYNVIRSKETTWR